MKVTLFIPCLTEHLFPESGLAMVRVLEHLGHTVEYLDDQSCCGQPAFNSGYRKEMIPIAERFIRLFQDCDVVVAPSGSCVAMVRVFYHQLALEPALKPGLDRLSSRLFEFTEFLVEQAGVTAIGGHFPHRVTYHDSCHLSRELGVKAPPRQLIQSIGGIDFVELDPPDLCCGFGGTFSYKFANVSVEMVKRKCESIEATGADYCIGADSSCLMNIEGYLRKHHMTARTLHIAELISRSLGLEGGA